MPDFTALENELNTKGTKILFEIKHNDQVLTFIYENVVDTKQSMDDIVSQYLPNYNISSTLESGIYKGDAIDVNAIL